MVSRSSSVAPAKLALDDARVEHQSVPVNGKNYHYLLGKPSGDSVGTVLLIHGFPDLSLGWRYQVPDLLSLGLRVIVPDTLGYGRTDAPSELEAYSHKKQAADMMAIVDHVAGAGSPVILGGHDWGGWLVWRIALWHPDRVQAVISVCTPYMPPSDRYLEPQQFVEALPNFRYQLQFAGPDVEAQIVGKAKLRQFLSAIHGATTPEGERAISIADGVRFDILDKIGPSPLLTEEELDGYVNEFDRHGLRGPLNSYRIRKINYEEEKELLKKGDVRIKVPSLMIVATDDQALPPSMAKAMPLYIDNLKSKEVDSGHWALWQRAEEVNKYTADFLTGVVQGLRGPQGRAAL